MSEAFVFHTYVYLILKAVLKREPAKKEFNRAVKAIAEYNPKAFMLFEKELKGLNDGETNIPKS